MKISNNALNFLLAQYRAIFKRAYIKGIASAVMLTAGLAAGQAHAAAPYLTGDNDHYYQQSGNSWKQHNATFHNTEGITAGALGGNYYATKDGLEQESKLEIVSGGELTIGGDSTQPGVLTHVNSGTVAGGWAVASTGNITAQDNIVHIVASGDVSMDGASNGSRGVIFGGYVVADKGMASALGNKIFVQDRDETNGLTKAAASNGLIGGRATGVGSAAANANEIHVLGTDATKRQVLGLEGMFDVLGGHATTKNGSTSSGGAYTANQNIIDLQHVLASGAGATDMGLTIAGARITPSGTGTFTVGATGNQVNITDLAVTTASGSQDVNIFGAWTPSELSSGTVAMSENTITLADSSVTKDTDYTGVVRIAAAAVQGNKSAQVSLTGNKVTLTDSVNEQDKAAVNTMYAEIVAGAIFDGERDDAKLTATVTGNSVEVGDGVNLTLDTTEGYIAGAAILVSGSKLQNINANNNSVSIAGDVTGSVYATLFFNNGDDLASSSTITFLNNDVTLATGGQVQSGSIVGGAGKDSVITIENGSTYIANNTSQDIASDVISIAGTVDVQAENTLDISGFYENGDVTAADTKFGDNLTSVASSAVIKNAGTINLYGKAVVDQGATLTATGADSVIKVDASKGITDSLLAEADKVVGGDQGTLAIFKDTLKSYLSADKVGSATTADSEASVQLTSGGTLEFCDTGNIDLATEFNFSNTSGTAGAIVVSGTANEGTIRGNELTISRKLAENAVATSESDTYATTYEGLTPTNLDTKGINIEANVLHLGSSTLESWQSEELTFGSATFRDQLTFAASSNGLSGTKAGTANQIINDGYHLVSEVIGDHYSVLQEQGTSLEDDAPLHYTAQDGVVEGDVIITATSSDSGSLVIRNGNYTADGSITIASGGNLTVGGDDKIDSNASDATNAPDATLVLGQALTFDLSKAGTGTVNVSGAESSSQRYDAVAAAETVGDDRHVVLDLRNGITLLGDADNDNNLSGSAKINVTSGGEILLTGSNLTSLLAQNNANNDASGAYFSASSGGAFIVEGDVDATFGDFNGSGSTSGKHGITLKDGGYLVANSLTIDNYQRG